MRRVLSVIFLAIGGWLFTTEPVMAFVDTKLGSWVTLMMLLFCLIFAAVPLAIGVALSPGDRRRELGLTILIALGFAALGAVSAAAIFFDPGFKQFQSTMPPMPDFGFAPVTGAVNLLILVALGWLLYRKQGDADPSG